jgi:hypothetical protein
VSATWLDPRYLTCVVIVRFGKTDGPVDTLVEVALAIADRLK